MATKNITIIKLVSTAGTGHYYTTTINKRKHVDKLKMKSMTQSYESMFYTKKRK